MPKQYRWPTDVTFEHIPRENKEADRLSRLATMYYDQLPQGSMLRFRKGQLTKRVSPKKLPKAKGEVEFVVVAVDYFSKWVEAVPLKKTT
ncbi:hypothetical protein LIER_27994 [Lithospermum erythrorhizon]|uniref:Uncharacterized protein n=1 Tax=Lithospermum erythrorhizon TaxID=34254 RepID=A0AAV3RF66_LITER